jgi:lipopolysaccharide export system protein LptA
MKQVLLITALFVFFLLLLAVNPVATQEKQQPTRVKIIQADELRFERRLGKDIRRLLGNVILEHDEVLMYCDSAYMQEASNSFEAFSKVRINSGDTLFLYGKYLRYNGNTRLAEVFYDVKLVDDSTVLTTEQLNYNRNTGIAYYERDGKITDKDNELTSRSGYYMTREKRAHFRKNVVLVNPEYVMRSDTLVYHTETQVSSFYGPTTIDAEDSFIYCENGWYDTKNDKAQFNKHAYIISGEHNIRGDSLYYNRADESAKAFENVVIVDTVQNVVLKGNYSEYYKHLGYTYITDIPVAIFIENGDSLYMHADTIRTTFNQDQDIERVMAYYKVKFFRDDLQGSCDSLIYKMSDSLIVMYRDPVLWTGESQLSADSIHINTNGETIENLVLYNSAFLINNEDSLQFNQVKGRNMTGYFVDGSLDNIVVVGNAETLYYVKEEDGYLIGINKAVASRMRIKLEDSKISRIYYFEKPDGTTFPDKDLPASERQLPDFSWKDDSRPKVWTDIFKR